MKWRISVEKEANRERNFNILNFGSFNHPISRSIGFDTDTINSIYQQHFIYDRLRSAGILFGSLIGQHLPKY